jgi:hypothetical protein
MEVGMGSPRVEMQLPPLMPDYLAWLDLLADRRSLPFLIFKGFYVRVKSLCELRRFRFVAPGPCGYDCRVDDVAFYASPMESRNFKAIPMRLPSHAELL